MIVVYVGVFVGVELCKWFVEKVGVILGIGLGMLIEDDFKGEGFFWFGYMGYFNVYMVFGMLGLVEVVMIVLGIFYGVGGFLVVVWVVVEGV